MRGYARPGARKLNISVCVGIESANSYVDPHLYYHGFEARTARFYARFVALCIQADVLGRPFKPYKK
jgi:hypothetical protein